MFTVTQLLPLCWLWAATCGSLSDTRGCSSFLLNNRKWSTEVSVTACGILNMVREDLSTIPPRFLVKGVAGYSLNQIFESFFISLQSKKALKLSKAHHQDFFFYNWQGTPHYLQGVGVNGINKWPSRKLPVAHFWTISGTPMSHGTVVKNHCFKPYPEQWEDIRNQKCTVDAIVFSTSAPPRMPPPPGHYILSLKCWCMEMFFSMWAARLLP